MTQTLISVAVFLVLLALLPVGIRWLQRRTPGGAMASGTARIVSAIAVGPQQRVVTVEVGPEDARTWLVLGVTAQHITCLHAAAAAPATPSAEQRAAPAEPAQS
jgi:flagellar protein FliO/FliZ